jgi:hypothetical protein
LRAARIGEQLDQPEGGRDRVVRVDQVPGFTVAHGVRRTARVTDDHGLAGRGGLQRDDAQGLGLEAEAAGSGWHREDVGGVDVRRDVLPGNGSGEPDRVSERLGERFESVAIGAAADEQEDSIRYGGEDSRPGADQGVLAFARDQAGDAGDHRAAQVEAFADLVSPAAWEEALGVDTGSQALDRCLRRQRADDSLLAPGGDRRDDVGGVADPAQGLPGRREARPPGLVTVAHGNDLPGSGLSQRRTHQAERSGGAEEDAVGVVLVHELNGSASDARSRQEHRGAVADHREGQRAVVRRVAGAARGVDDGVGQLVAERADEGLDPALPGREVVGDDQDGHREAGGVGDSVIA